MDCKEEHKALTIIELKNPIKHFRSEELLQYSRPVDWICKNVITLFHWAVVQECSDLIKTVLNAGTDVNTVISFSDTALLISLKLNKFEAVKVLLDADADVGVIDVLTHKTALSILMAKQQNVIEYLLPNLMGNLKRSKLDAETLAKLLATSDCPLEYVLAINDIQISYEYLKCNHLGNFESGMKLAMDKGDLEHVELILRYGNTSGRLAFYNQLYRLYMMNEIESWKVFIKCLSDWNVVSEEGLTNLQFLFLVSTTEHLQLWLNCKIDVQVREKFGIDLRASIFGNWNVNAIEILHSHNFNISRPGVSLQSALHFAVNNNLLENVRYLLDLGANVNIKDAQGRSALFNCKRQDIGQLLLENGADVQVVDKYGMTVLEFAKKILKVDSSLMELLLAQLAIDYAQDLPIKQSIEDQIYSDENYKNFFETCSQQLQILKTCEVLQPITLEVSPVHKIIKQVSLFTVLTDNIETLCRFVYNQDITHLLEQYKNKHKVHFLYYSTLKTKFMKISNMHRFNCNMADIISEHTGNIIDFDHLVIRNICKYLNQKDIDEFIKCICTSGSLGS